MYTYTRGRIKGTHIYNRKQLFFRVTLCFLAPKHPLLFPFSDIVVGGPQPLLFGRGELCSLAEKPAIFLMNCTRLQPQKLAVCKVFQRCWKMALVVITVNCETCPGLHKQRREERSVQERIIGYCNLSSGRWSCLIYLAILLVYFTHLKAHIHTRERTHMLSCFPPPPPPPPSCGEEPLRKKLSPLH